MTTRFFAPWALLLAVPVAAQQTPPGFATRTVFVERGQPFSVRTALADPTNGGFVLGFTRTVLRQDGSGGRWVVHAFQSPEDLGAMLRPRGATTVYYTALQAGTCRALDLSSGAQSAFPGVANAFDLTVTGRGELLASANPRWPAPGAATGIWLLDPLGGPARELIALRGPSGPLLADSGGGLVVADLGTAWPIPAGGVRLLHFSRSTLDRAVLGGALLGIGDGNVVGPPLDGAYDLAFDDRGRLHVSDGQSGIVLRTLPGSYALDPVPAVRVPGSALGLEFIDGVAPFSPFQPAAVAGALLVLRSDWSSETALDRLEPRRPTLAVRPAGGAVPAGPLALDITAGPSGATAWIAATFAPLIPERAVAMVDGLPVWLALTSDPVAFVVTTAISLDASGRGSLPLVHPGGFSATLNFQALALSAPGTGLHGSTAALTVVLLP